MLNWPAPLRRQVQTLLDQFLRAPGSAWIGIAGIDRLGSPGVISSTMRLGGRLETLGSRPTTRAFVWVQGTEPELWVDPTDTGYRDLYDEFARERLGLPGRPPGGVFNIDHVFPKATAALDGLSHVRAIAVPADSNQAAGRTLEKAMKQRADSGLGSGKEIRHATWMSIGKAAGFTGWESLPDGRSAAGNAKVVQALFADLAGKGITPPAGTLEHGLTAHTLTRIG
ncbi:hypothetical protein M0638_02650 [Roseomonas sp. NAR14]|uniref:Uncharacterized protein n=1 Tax=Roseomonas acroporae TaxID=2937791 RepID=A0A9X1Y579_9PROT|nr:hypothetical protein [Roseomonas acroporae]MCK8783280.1 hypothetical protein [Roseomonas acroporae]